jgi:excisionase family DNA binding protein
MEKKFYTVPQIAQELEISEDLVRLWIRKKELPAYRVGKEFRIKKEDYEKYLETKKTDKE